MNKRLVKNLVFSTLQIALKKIIFSFLGKLVYHLSTNYAPKPHIFIENSQKKSSSLGFLCLLVGNSIFVLSKSYIVQDSLDYTISVTGDYIGTSLAVFGGAVLAGISYISSADTSYNLIDIILNKDMSTAEIAMALTDPATNNIDTNVISFMQDNLWTNSPEVSLLNNWTACTWVNATQCTHCWPQIPGFSIYDLIFSGEYATILARFRILTDVPLADLIHVAGILEHDLSLLNHAHQWILENLLYEGADQVTINRGESFLSYIVGRAQYLNLHYTNITTAINELTQSQL